MQNSVQVPSQLWTQPWYRTDIGDLSVFVYIVLIHSLAAVGLVLFPLPVQNGQEPVVQSM